MAKNTTIQIRINWDQYEKIKLNSKLKGFKSLTAFLLHSAIDQELILHQKINEIHSHLLGKSINGSSTRKYKLNPTLRQMI